VAVVLVVEDDTLVQQLVCKLLQSIGHTVLRTESGRQALRVLKYAGKVIELLVLDIALPDISGIELAQKFRRMRRGVPIVVVSGVVGEHDSEVRDQLNEIGVQQIFTKPFETKSFLTAVRYALLRRR